MVYNCMSKKSWPILYSNLLYEMGRDFLDMQYTRDWLTDWMNDRHVHEASAPENNGENSARAPGWTSFRSDAGLWYLY